ncbi:phosphoadenosine phosphosulfate reductase family protein [uncultured Megasphaera sp.]|uniref:phosphoadenosine phosphosulfate reductase domain-containing protein n=1 Tax=uncultured Megasphaera sp. TaxID=165188 RepID=UPI0025943443|nr:phosphoadenosine phosphosulfate reductase family protein [uncultured Megasphaera sp.]
MPPFPFLHVNTTWKFKEMIRFRDETMKKYGLPGTDDSRLFGNSQRRRRRRRRLLPAHPARLPPESYFPRFSGPD